jgi:hypothetical protein
MRARIHMSLTLVFLSSVILLSCNSKPSLDQSPAMASKRILGVSLSNNILGFSPWSNPKYALMKGAGIGWVRLGFAFPFEDKIGGKLTKEFMNDLQEAKKIRKLGLRIMGGTPVAGEVNYDEKQKRAAWRSGIPEWAGSIDSDGYYETYERACEEIGRQTRRIVDIWQVSNEMDLGEFRGPLSIEQAARFLTAGARGLKRGNPKAKADVNPASPDSNGEQLLRELYSKSDTPFDYAGIDGYFGSWATGGPPDWIPVIEKIHEITRKPVLINEWGYSSIQGSGKPLKQKVGNPVCDKQTWNHVWRKEHSPEEQAAYVRIALKIFATYPNVIGCFFYEWSDDAVCTECGSKGCPSECGWGLVDTQGNPKPAYYAFKAMAQEYFNNNFYKNRLTDYEE